MVALYWLGIRLPVPVKKTKSNNIILKECRGECPAIHNDPELKTTTEGIFKMYSKQTDKSIIQIHDVLRQWE